MIRVGADYYLTGTTMHTMPGLPILHSRDLVNWRIIGYAFDRLDLGPDFRLEEGKQIYGQGIWAPSFGYHNGTFYIFANVNRFGLQVFRASSPRGPWSHNRIEQGLHDLSVLFDDDAGADHKWYWADARIEGDTIIVSSPSVPNPVAVRYAWQSFPTATMYNERRTPRRAFSDRRLAGRHVR